MSHLKTLIALQILRFVGYPGTSKSDWISSSTCTLKLCKSLTVETTQSVCNVLIDWSFSKDKSFGECTVNCMIQ